MQLKTDVPTFGKLMVGVILFCSALTVPQAKAAEDPAYRTLSADTRFFVPKPADGSIQQALKLLEKGQLRNAVLIAEMEATPQAVWLTGGTSSEVISTVTQVLHEARRQHAIPTFVLYNVPGRDCGSYSAGGAQDTAAYTAWIDAVVTAIGSEKVMVLVEPDALANLPSDCGYNPAQVNIPQATANRYNQISYAVTKLETGLQTSVYLDAGNSAWHSVGDMSERLVKGGLLQAQGFFSNVSNYRLSSYEEKFGTWISKCVAFGQNSADGGWRLGHYDYCASQYYSPLGIVNPNDISTWTYSDQWYTQNLGGASPITHFVIDTSRNGQGPLDASIYGKAPYNQPAAVVQTLGNGNWCNPPGRGLGNQPSANTGVPLLDAYLWVKTPGQSDGACDAAGGVRAWDYSAYTQPGWPKDSASQATFDPLWGVSDPAAGLWFPQQALDLVQRAQSALKVR